ncbi:cytochrome [Pantoea ananatis]|uniref:cytochrome n=1 Tax=Pantoea ananas TaxID=553 RepID=UPI00352B8D8C
MDFSKMMEALAPKKTPVEISGYTFYARPMSVVEFSEHVSNPSKNDRDDLMILNCITDESGEKVFESLEQVKQLYTNVRSELASACAQASILLPATDIEKELK